MTPPLRFQAISSSPDRCLHQNPWRLKKSFQSEMPRIYGASRQEKRNKKRESTIYCFNRIRANGAADGLPIDLTSHEIHRSYAPHGLFTCREVRLCACGVYCRPCQRKSSVTSRTLALDCSAPHRPTSRIVLCGLGGVKRGKESRLIGHRSLVSDDDNDSNSQCVRYNERFLRL